MQQLSVIVPVDSGSAGVGAQLAAALSPHVREVVLAGNVEPSAPGDGVRWVRTAGGRGSALKAALPGVSGAYTALVEPTGPRDVDSYAALLAPLQRGSADAVWARREGAGGLSIKALSQLAALVTDVSLRDPLSGLRAFRTDALRSLPLVSEGDEVDAELWVKLSAQLFRVGEVSLAHVNGHPPTSQLLAVTRALLRFASAEDVGAHDGHRTLLRMEGAPNYNAWIGRRLREHLGQRVLEVGAGIGTITQQLEDGRELVVALEMERFYVDRLKNLFRDKPHVHPELSGVERADWERLAKQRFDTVVLSNVLEHIEDDALALSNFHRVLQPGGKLLILVPALPALFGAMDEAVGHFRRYTREGLKAVLEGQGFSVERLEWMNLVGIPGWFVNGRLFRRRQIPALQLRLYDRVAPLLAEAESRVRLPVGMSLFAVARRGI